ncbi:hypothetical protein JI58_00935 [Marinosulfonomonas sp. PRT-SC04]|nr:hypothetical protein JI58_00935 [Marinosulfonomonas sp. PRT-SC04]
MTEALPDGRLSAPSAERNAAPIFKLLAQYMPVQGMVLELASGTGQHIAALAVQHPHLAWQPSDVSDQRMGSVEAWRAQAGAANLCAPIVLDASGAWPALEDLRLIYVVNLFHLISATDAQAVIRGAAAALTAGGYFFIYGPFRTDGGFRSDGDAAFDASLRAQDESIGYKDLEWMQAELVANGLELAAAREMPANNLVLVGGQTGSVSQS